MIEQPGNKSIEDAVDVKIDDIPQEWQRLYDDFCQKPVPDSLWGEAYEAVSTYEANGGKAGVYDWIPAQDLINLAETMRKTPDFRERYRYLVENGLNDKLWYDVLETLHNPDGYKAFDKFLGNLFLGVGRFDEALDVGCGAGELTAVLQKYSSRTCGTDAVPELTKLAESRNPGIEFKVGDALNAGFKDNQFQVVVSSGFSGTLNAKTLGKFSAEVGRILRPGGFFIESFQIAPENGGFTKDQIRTLSSPKGILADGIVDEVNGSNHRSDTISIFKGMRDNFPKNGLQLSIKKYPAENTILLIAKKVA